MTPSPVFPQRSHMTTYIFVVLLTGLVIMIAAGSVLVARPTVDNTSIVVPLLGAGAATLAGILAIIKADIVSQQVLDIHVTMNSQLDKWRDDNRLATETAAAAAREAAKNAQITAEYALARAHADGIKEGIALAAHVGLKQEMLSDQAAQ